MNQKTLKRFTELSERIDEVIARAEFAMDNIRTLNQQGTTPDPRQEADEIALAVSELMDILKEIKTLDVPMGDIFAKQVEVMIQRLKSIDRVVTPISKALHKEYAKEEINGNK